MAEVKLGRGRARRAAAESEDEMAALGLPDAPQNNQIIATGPQQIQVVSQPQVVQLPSPNIEFDRGADGARLEQVSRLLEQNPHLRTLYNGQVAIEDMSEMELRRLEQRFKQHLEGGSETYSRPQLPTIEPSQLAYESFGADGALAPQGLMSPRGLMMSLGFTAPQGLLAPRSVGSAPAAPPPKDAPRNAAESSPQPAAPQKHEPAPQASPQPSTPGQHQASHNGLHYDATGHFEPVQGPSLNMSGRSPFAEVIGRVIASIASLFGLQAGGRRLLGGGDSGGGPIIQDSPRKKR